tara:strand:- start:759 stop:992 length:234 start_codon:yes stop_codon:yes gene_type:complete
VYKMTRIIAKTDNHSFGRDLDSKAVINTDRTAYQNYKSKRSIMKQEAEKAQQLASDVEQLKSDISEIKNMLQSIARG